MYQLEKDNTRIAIGDEILQLAKENEKIFIAQYYQDQILEGWYDADGEMTLKSGSGKNFKKMAIGTEKVFVENFRLMKLKHNSFLKK